MEPGMERERSGLSALFQGLISDMKGSLPLWDDLVSKGGKLQTQLRATLAAVASFLDAFQRVADAASGSRGAMQDLGAALTRLCLRHRSIETKLRNFSGAFADHLVAPLQEQMDDWKKNTQSLDKDHHKECKKLRQELKKRSSDSLKLQKKNKKGPPGGAVELLEELERNAVRRALLEERGRFCFLVAKLRPLMDEEMRLLADVSHLQSLSEDLRILTMDPHKLPPAGEQLLLGLTSSESSWSFQTPPTSPTSPGAVVSRTSSMSSSVNSVGSGGSSDAPLFRCGQVQLGSASSQLGSASSQDSGFNSQDLGAAPVWDGAPLQPVGGAVRRGRERDDRDPRDRDPRDRDPRDRDPRDPRDPRDRDPRDRDPRDRDPRDRDPRDHRDRDPRDRDPRDRDPRDPRDRDPRDPRDPRDRDPRDRDPRDRDPRDPRDRDPRDRDPREELLQALTRGLDREQSHAPSCPETRRRDSAYSCQGHTPSCSDDLTGSDGDHFSSEAELHTPTDSAPLARRLLPPRCASLVSTPGVATIRRAPSSKASLRRSSLGLSLGPAPVRPPMIPVKTPTVPRPLATEPPAPPPPQPVRRGADRRKETQQTDYLTLIRRGVKLKTNAQVDDRSAPRIQ